MCYYIFSLYKLKSLEILVLSGCFKINNLGNEFVGWVFPPNVRDPKFERKKIINEIRLFSS
jgi:hypothetical protein